MAKVLITGITGFLGSNIGRVLLSKGHQVVGLKRSTSSLELCDDYVSNVSWIDQDSEGRWLEIASDIRPDVIIHSAWIGVTHADRNDWDSQFQNIAYLQQLLQVAKRCGIQKFIGLGSQAEYGPINGVVDESDLTLPTEAYGRMKVISSALVQQFCEHHHIDWYWLRLFSFFGKGESPTWLIPSLVKKMQSESVMDFTPGEQKYAYLFVEDLGLAINNVILSEKNSGIYNISGKRLLTLKFLIESIRDNVDPSFQLNFGALPYRQNQSMHMQGNSSKFIKAFGEFDVSNFETALSETIEHLKQRFTTIK